MEIIEDDWADRFAALIRKRQAAVQADAALRRNMLRLRAAGLKQRQAAKLARLVPESTPDQEAA